MGPGVSGGFLHDVALHHVALFDVVIALQAHAAFKARAHFLHVLLVVLQGGQLAGEHHHVIPQQTHLGVALHLAILHIAAGNGARAGNLEHAAHLGMAQQHFLVLGRQEPLHGLFHVLDGIVDHGVQPHIHLFLLRGSSGGGVGADVEADDNGVETRWPGSHRPW